MSKPGDLNLNLIRAFLAVAAHGSFTKAAQALGQTKSNLSHRVTELERTMDTRLLNRSTRQISMTEEGQLFYERCQPLFQEMENAVDDLAQRRSEPRGELKIAAPLALGNFLMQRVVANFVEHYPKLSLVFNFDDKYSNFVVDSVDVAIRVGQAADQSLITRKLVNVSLALFVSPTYFSDVGEINAPSDLMHHSFIYFHTGNSKSRQLTLTKGRETVDVSFRNYIGANYYAGNQSLAMAGHGVALLPRFLQEDALKRGDLVEVLSDWTGPSVEVYAAYSTQRHLSPKVRAFVDFIAEDSRSWNCH